QEDLLHIYEAIRNPESDEWADYDGEEISFSFEDGSLSVLSIPVKVAALSAPTVSGLTDEERAEGRRLLAEAEAAYELGETPDRVRTAKDLQAWLFFNAKELLSLSPAPSIDWKRVAEVRERADELERLGHLAYHDWASEAHADRAFLLSLLPKQEG
ncbi:MAG: hypothetical protein B7Z37_27895, partial [Verrucomicrobia bacterium 12-59-8]